jgi:hypothetical protein
MEALKIILLCIAAAVVYGIGQDLITTRVCLEYFTIGHPPIFGGTQNPTLLALGWGVIATWWIGLGLGVPAALLTRAGSRPKLGWQSLRVPIVVLMGVMAASATIAGLLAYLSSGINDYYFPEKAVFYKPQFQADAAAHSTAYFVGFAGGILICGLIWWRRGRLERAELRAEIERLRRENRELVERMSK